MCFSSTRNGKSPRRERASRDAWHECFKRLHKRADRLAAASEAGSDNPYCYKMYGKAYSLCVSDDRGCKMIAANDWGICKKTGRWP